MAIKVGCIYGTSDFTSAPASVIRRRILLNQLLENSLFPADPSEFLFVVNSLMTDARANTSCQ